MTTDEVTLAMNAYHGIGDAGRSLLLRLVNEADVPWVWTEDSTSLPGIEWTEEIGKALWLLQRHGLVTRSVVLQPYGTLTARGRAVVAMIDYATFAPAPAEGTTTREPDPINGPACPSCGWANVVLRKRCRNCNADLVMHPDPAIDAEVRLDAEDGRRADPVSSPATSVMPEREGWYRVRWKGSTNFCIVYFDGTCVMQTSPDGHGYFHEVDKVAEWGPHIDDALARLAELEMLLAAIESSNAAVLRQANISYDDHVAEAVRQRAIIDAAATSGVDETEPPPGWFRCDGLTVEKWQKRTVHVDSLAESHRIYAAECRPAVEVAIREYESRIQSLRKRGREDLEREYRWKAEAERARAEVERLSTELEKLTAIDEDATFLRFGIRRERARIRISEKAATERDIAAHAHAEAEEHGSDHARDVLHALADNISASRYPKDPGRLSRTDNAMLHTIDSTTGEHVSDCIGCTAAKRRAGDSWYSDRCLDCGADLHPPRMDWRRDYCKECHAKHGTSGSHVEPVIEWNDGRAKVGGVTITKPYGRSEPPELPWQFRFFRDGHRMVEVTFFINDGKDAHRLAVALAWGMQRGDP